MANNGFPNPSLNEFMVDNAQVNWNVVWIVYGSGDLSELMVDRGQIIFFIGFNPWTNTQNKRSN
jgi:hypothetical protein